MEEPMNALQLLADWQPKATYQANQRELETHRVLSGSQVWRNPRLEFGQVATPEINADEVLLEVAAVGICGSDMHMYEADQDGYILYPGLTRFPNILGHEFSGRVLEVGSDVGNLEVGALVAVEEVNWCGVCDACRRGLVNHCTQLEEIGFTTPGAMAQYIAVKAKYCWRLEEIAERSGDLSEAMVLGAMVEPVGVSYHAMFNRLSTWKPGAYAAVFGGGPIGLAAIALARAAGASQIIAFDVSEKRLEIARNLGATATLNPVGLDLNTALLELTRGHGVDFVIEAAGAPQRTLSPLTTGLAVGATIAHIGRSEKPTSLALEHYQVRGVQLAGSLGHAGHGTFPNVIRLMASGKLDMRAMVSARLPLSEAKQAFKRLESREDAKIILLPGEA
jgi:scyllo-inosose 3-dehydrogenase